MSLLRTLQKSTGQTALRLQRSAATTIRMQSDSAAPAVADAKGSEVAKVPVKEVVTADLVSGAPAELRHRTVRVYKPASNTMQSGGAKSSRWRIDFDILQGGGRWENPLMGWASSADYNQGLRMSFRSKEDAIHFAEKQGWDFYVQQEPVARIPPKNYSENFLYRPDKLRIHRTK